MNFLLYLFFAHWIGPSAGSSLRKEDCWVKGDVRLRLQVLSTYSLRREYELIKQRTVYKSMFLKTLIIRFTKS